MNTVDGSSHLFSHITHLSVLDPGYSYLLAEQQRNLLILRRKFTVKPTSRAFGESALLLNSTVEDLAP
jgi:hypothetical protein